LKQAETIRARDTRDYLQILGIALLIGIAVGIADVFILTLYDFVSLGAKDIEEIGWPMIVATPALGLLVAYIFAKYLSAHKTTSGGSHRLLEAYHFHGGQIGVRDAIVEPLASAVTMGSGGSAGFDGPSLLLGGGIGSIIAQRLRVTPEELKTLLLAGAAAESPRSSRRR